ncbi:MAG: non-homologous end joining protein Ku, partial [Candidatus Binatia bacterium]
LKALEGEASKAIEIEEFVPLAKVDPIYFEKTYYLGPDKGGEKPYRLLADAMTQAGKVALAKFIMRGKENLVLIRSAQDGLMLHTMYFADEVRSFDEVAKGETAKISGAETNLALRLIEELSNQEFEAGKYEDQYRRRVTELVNTKAEGKEITVAAPQAKRAQVIDLMAALKESLGKKSNLKERKPAVRAKSTQPEKDRKSAKK